MTNRPIASAPKPCANRGGCRQPQNSKPATSNTRNYRSMTFKSYSAGSCGLANQTSSSPSPLPSPSGRVGNDANLAIIPNAPASPQTCCRQFSLSPGEGPGVRGNRLSASVKTLCSAAVAVMSLLLAAGPTPAAAAEDHNCSPQQVREFDHPPQIRWPQGRQGARLQETGHLRRQRRRPRPGAVA